MWMNRNAEKESILKYKSPSPSTSILHVHPHLILLFSIFFPFDIFPFCLFHPFTNRLHRIKEFEKEEEIRSMIHLIEDYYLFNKIIF